MTSAVAPAHDLVPFPSVGIGEVRMIYCRRCGATQPVESRERPALPPCALMEIAAPLSFRAASPLVEYGGTTGSFSADPDGIYFTEYLGDGKYGATVLVARPTATAVPE